MYWYERPGIDAAWMITRHADVKAVSADSRSFINGGPQLRYASRDYNQRARVAKLRKAELHGWDPEVVDDMIYLDAPDHTKLRMLTARSFTPARCRAMAAMLDGHATRFVAEFEEALDDRGEVDLVNDLAVKLPLATICSMLGVSVDDWADIHRWTDAMFDVDNMRWAAPGEDRRAMRKRLHAEFHRYIDDLISAKQANPGDDLASQLVHATVDGDPLDHQELHGYLKLLISGGNETTRNATSRGILALLERPDQIELLEARSTAAGADAGRRGRPLHLAGDPVRAHGHARRRGGRAGRPGRPDGGAVVSVGQPRRRPSSSGPTSWTSPGSRTTTSASGTARTSASGPTWPAGSCGPCSPPSARPGSLSRLEVAGPPRWLTDLHVGTDRRDRRPAALSARSNASHDRAGDGRRARSTKGDERGP